MKKIIFTEHEINNIIKLYANEKISTRDIGLIYKISSRIISKILKNNKITLRKSGQQFIGGKTESDKRYYIKNKEKINKYYSTWVENNRVHLKDYHKQWRKDNHEKWKETKRTYEKNRKSVDPLYKLIGNFRTAIYTVLKENNVKKYGHYFDILGYSQEDLIQHLEKQFQDGVSWDNYGEWHVDHIKPISLFNFKSIDDEEFKECWSLNNLQPMWGNENISKSDNYNS